MGAARARESGTDAVRVGARRRLEADEAAGRAYVAAFVAESVKQLEAQGVPPCVNR